MSIPTHSHYIGRDAKTTARLLPAAFEFAQKGKLSFNTDAGVSAGSDDLAPSFTKRRDRRCRECFSKRYGSAAPARKAKVKK
jgi:hypothetical protein